jgi:hypothetical protein
MEKQHRHSYVLRGASALLRRLRHPFGGALQSAGSSSASHFDASYSRLRRRLSRGRRVGRLNAAATLLLVALLFLGANTIGSTIAYFTNVQQLSGNNMTTAKAFAPTDVAAVPQKGGAIQVSWSKLTWATGLGGSPPAYSIRRSTSPTGPFDASTEVGTTDQNTPTFTDTIANGLVDGTTYYYVIHGISNLGGKGLDSSPVSARPDNTNPVLASSTPAKGTTGNSRATAITVQFTESGSMNKSLSSANIDLVTCGNSSCGTPGTTAIDGVKSWTNNQTFSFATAADLAGNTWYGIRIIGEDSLAGSPHPTDVVADLAGNNYVPTAGDCTRRDTASNVATCYVAFRTGGSDLAAGVSIAVPASGATGVAQNTNVALRFTGAALSGADQTDLQNNFSLQQLTGSGAPCYVVGGTPLCASSGGSFTSPGWSNNTLTFNPTNNLVSGALYQVSETANTSNIVVSYSATFTTGSGTDTTAPRVSTTVPAVGATAGTPTTGIDLNTTLRFVFSEAMSPGFTIAATTLVRMATAATCTGGTTNIAGTFIWQDTQTLDFNPTAALTASACYRVDVSTTARDGAGNVMTAAYQGFFKTGATTPVLTLSGFLNGSLFYPGASITATTLVTDATRWSASQTVSVMWDDGTTLASATSGASGQLSLPFNLPTTASASSHVLTFKQTTGTAIGVTKSITVRLPTQIILSASPTDIKAGQSTTITATLIDSGQAAQNAKIGFCKASDPSNRGTLGTPSNSGVTDTNGQVTVTLSASAGGTFQDITISGYGGQYGTGAGCPPTSPSPTVSDSIVIMDPPPLPPTNLALTSSAEGLVLSWHASPSTGVKGYQVAIGTTTGKYDLSFDVGAPTTYTYKGAAAGKTYYAVARAYDVDGAISNPSAEGTYTMPPPTPTPTATRPPATATPATSPTALAPKASPTPTAPPTTATPTAVPVVSSPTPLAPKASPTVLLLAGNATGLAGSGSAGSPTPAPGGEAAPSVATASPTSIAIKLSPTAIAVQAGSPTPLTGGAAATATPIVVKGSPTPTVAVGAPSKTPTAAPTTPPTATRTPTAPPTATATPLPPSPTVLTIAGSGAGSGGAASPTPMPLAGGSGSTSSATATPVPLLGQPPALLSTATPGTVRVGSTTTPVAVGSPTAIAIKGASPTPIALGASPTMLPAIQLFASANQPTTSSSMPSTTNSLYPSASASTASSPSSAGGQPTPSPTVASGTGGLAGIYGLMAAATPTPAPGTPTATPTPATAAGGGVGTPSARTATSTPGAGPGAGTPTPLAPKASPTVMARQ